MDGEEGRTYFGEGGDLPSNGKPTTIAALEPFTFHSDGGSSMVTPASSIFVDTQTSETASATPTQSVEIFTTNVVASTAAPVEAAPSEGMSYGVKMAAILTPILVTLALIPVIYLIYLHYRNKRRDHQRLRSPDMRDTQQAYLKPPPPVPPPPPQGIGSFRSPQEKSILLPSPFSESERIKSGSLGVYEVRQSLDDRARTESIGFFSPDPKTRYSGRASSELERGPSPTLPSPSVTTFRPISESWPLPKSGKLPEPEPPHEAHPNARKALPSPAATSRPPPILPAARSETLAASRSPSSDYGSTPTSSAFPQPPRSTVATPQTQRFDSGLSNGKNNSNNRESDLVSDMSMYDDVSSGGGNGGNGPGEADQRSRRDTDALSVVSAMTAGGGGGSSRRRSTRDADAVSVVSALSPDERPDRNMEHFPFPSR